MIHSDNPVHQDSKTDFNTIEFHMKVIHNVVFHFVNCCLFNKELNLALVNWHSYYIISFSFSGLIFYLSFVFFSANIFSNYLSIYIQINLYLVYSFI